MATHVAFLRGINVGSANRVAMPALRAMAEGLGYVGVATHINSGNLLFDTEDAAATTEAALASAIRDTFGLPVDVAVRTRAQLERVLAANPFPDADPSRATVAFLLGDPAPEAEARMAALAGPDEAYVLGGREIYVLYGRGMGDSKLAARFASVVGVSATVRNVRTVAKVLQMC